MLEKATRRSTVDLEASSQSSQGYPIEIGLVLSNGQEYQALLEPFSDWWFWDKSAESVHNITRSQLARQGQSVISVCEEINELCRGEILYSDCWVLDNNWMNLMFSRAGIQPTFTCAPVENLFCETKIQYLSLCKDRVQRCLGVAKHRALADASILQWALSTLENLDVKKCSPSRLGKEVRKALQVQTKLGQLMGIPHHRVPAAS